jgi:von Willebrand factor A domain-containing protein 7
LLSSHKKEKIAYPALLGQKGNDVLHSRAWNLGILLFSTALSPLFGDLIIPSQATVTVTPGETFSVDASVTGIQDLYAFQFDWSFDPSLLAVDSVTEGTFLPSAGATFFLPGFFDSLGGSVDETADALLGAIPGVTGSGVLASATFTAIAAGTVAITLPNQILLDSNLNPITPTTVITPEPSSVILLLLGLLLLLCPRIFLSTIRERFHARPKERWDFVARKSVFSVSPALRPMICCVGVLIVGTPPLLALKPDGHEKAVRDALNSTKFSWTASGHTYTFSRTALNELVNNDREQDDGFVNLSPPFTIAQNHFDNETLGGASTLVILRLKDAETALKATRRDGQTARLLVGKALHAIQDFYAHSNWMDRNPRDEQIATFLGESTIQAVDLDVKTCLPPPNTGTYVPSFTMGFTSGYYFGRDGKDDSKLPLGKCYHGLKSFFLNVDYKGINRDTESGAVQRATEATKDFIMRFLQRPGIGDNRDAVAAFMGVKGLSFVIDDTGSMGPTISSVQSQVANIVNFAASSLNPGSVEYTLVRFGDPTVGSAFSTTDANALIAQVNAIFPNGGGDCPELSEAGLYQGVSAALSNSQVYLFTDASSKDASLAGAVNSLARQKSVAITPMPTGSCSPIDPAYKANAFETGGQLFVLAPSELASVFELVKPQLAGDLSVLQSVTGNLGGTLKPTTSEFSVDSTVTQLQVALSVDSFVSFSLVRPDASIVQSTDSNVSLRRLSTGIVITVRAPIPGRWHFQFTGANEYYLSVVGNSEVAIDRLELVRYGNEAHPGYFPLPTTPKPGEIVTVLLSLDGPIFTPSVLVIDTVTNAIVQTVQVSSNADTPSGAFVGDMLVPNQAFRLVATGFDANGNPIQRAQASPVILHSLDMTVDAATLPDSVSPARDVTFRFLATNSGATGDFSLTRSNNLGFLSTGQTMVRINSGQTIPVEVNVTIPAVLASDSSLVLTATLTRTDDDSATASSSATVFVNRSLVPGDVNQDGVVNCIDLSIVQAAFGKSAGEPGFDVQADVVTDGKIDVRDLAFISRRVPVSFACR